MHKFHFGTYAIWESVSRGVAGAAIEPRKEKLKRLLDKEFAKDVSLKGYTDEIILNEVDGMTDMLYEKQGSYLQGKEDDRKEVAQILIKAGKLSPDEAVSLLHVSKSDILSNVK